MTIWWSMIWSGMIWHAMIYDIWHMIYDIWYDMTWNHISWKMHRSIRQSRRIGCQRISRQKSRWQHHDKVHPSSALSGKSSWRSRLSWPAAVLLLQDWNMPALVMAKKQKWSDLAWCQDVWWPAVDFDRVFEHVNDPCPYTTAIIFSLLCRFKRIHRLPVLGCVSISKSHVRIRICRCHY